MEGWKEGRMEGNWDGEEELDGEGEGGGGGRGGEGRENIHLFIVISLQ